LSQILLDTNAYSALMIGNTDVLYAIESSTNVLFSVVVLGELLSGFKGGHKENENINIINDFIEMPKVKVVEINQKTSYIFAGIKNYLKTKGKPIPINDVWIAANTFEHEAELITFDKHFQEIPNIKIWDK
jgi:tRNA(fMet)-specific endonuclease VapC